MPTVADILAREEQCHHELALESYNFSTGQQDSLDIVSIMCRYHDLYSRETYDFVTGLGERELADANELRMLKHLVSRNFIFDQLKEQAQELENAESQAVVNIDGEDKPYHSVPILLSNEPDYDKRGRMDAAFIQTLASLNPQREELDARERELIGSLGYKGAIDFCERLSNLRIYPIRELTRQFLSDTAEVYEEQLGRYAAKAQGLTRPQLRHGDISYLMRVKRFDTLFPADGLVPALSRSLAGLGIDLERQTNVTLDLDVRPKKKPRAFCMGVDVPRDVRLSLYPRGGQDDYATLFHEAGHLEFCAHMGAEQSFLFRYYGDTSVHESFAFLFEHLTSDPVWWHEVMHAKPELPDGESFIAAARFHRLYMMRRYSAKMQYEVAYHEAGGGSAQAPVYAQWLQTGTGIPYPPQRYLADFDGGFYVLQYLQAWIWEVQLRSHLQREFGEAWFTKRSAGDFLRDLWRDAMRYDVWETAQRLGYAGLDIAPLKDELLG